MIGDLERGNIRLKATAGVARYKIKHMFKEINNQVVKRWRTNSWVLERGDRTYTINGNQRKRTKRQFWDEGGKNKYKVDWKEWQVRHNWSHWQVINYLKAITVKLLSSAKIQLSWEAIIWRIKYNYMKNQVLYKVNMERKKKSNMNQ